MCLSPITIPNQSKYISTKHNDLFLMQVPCGHCCECQQTMSNQWYYRAWYEWNDLDKANGYVLFDTLTYSDKCLPRLSDFWSVIDNKVDFPCFDYSHIRKFLQLLRQRCIRAGYSKNAFRYFLSTEYGSHDYYTKNGVVKRATHRPHYHLLLYVYDIRIDPLWLSCTISDIWRFGRTDGVEYRGASYVLGKNVVRCSDGSASKLRTCHYVTKYVQKSCAFQSVLDKRIAKVMFELAKIADPVTPDTWLQSELARRERLKLFRLVNQFHRQSQHFGESALADLDISELFKNGCMYMPDFKALKIPVPLSTYYKRKLFYDLVEFNGSRYWVLNDLGKEYRSFRDADVRQRLVDRYDCVIKQFNLGFDASALANYVLDFRGRITGSLPESTLVDRMNDVDLVNYSTCSDKLQFGCRGLTELWLGDSQQGYSSNHMFGRITLSDFVQKHVYFNPVYETQLDKLFSCMQQFNVLKQAGFKLKQDLTQKYKCLTC